MTIKEAEARTGLVRANIRYYEDQGFFTAARGENGYRDYSEENIDILLKVKLLRQLGFSLEEIRGLQKGERSLEPALAEREASLEQERRELDQAARLCRDIRSDGADFYTLDARRYLDRLAQTEQVLTRDRDPVRIFPWRRYFARSLDFSLYAAVSTLVLQATLRWNMLRQGQLLPALASLVLMLSAEPVMLHWWGTTPGKALLGLKVLREDGSPLGWEQAIRRTGLVTAFFGGSLLLSMLPLPLSILGLGMDVWACWQAYQGRPLFWETDQLYLDGSSRERAFWDCGRNYLRVGGWLAVFAASIGLMVGGHFLAARPPHTGPSITMEEFVENYNHYQAFTYGEEHLTQRLALDGTFEAIPREGTSTVVIPITGFDRIPDPSFRFGQGDSGLEQVTFLHSFQTPEPLGEGTYFVSIPYEKIYTAMRALLYGRLRGRQVDALYQALVQADGNFYSSQSGVTIDSQVSFTGFDRFPDGLLLAEKGQQQTYFVQFTIELT